MGALKLEEQEERQLKLVHAQLTPQEEGFVTLIANIITDFTLNQLYEERNTLSAV